MLLPIIITFLLAFVMLLFKPQKMSRFFKFISVIPLLLFLYLLSCLPSVHYGAKSVFCKNEWIPSLGISLDFKIVGLSMLFSLMITGIGTLIYLYAAVYLKKDENSRRFYCYLTLL